MCSVPRRPPVKRNFTWRDVPAARSVSSLPTRLARPTCGVGRYESPPDPTWVPGFFDDGDFDDVVVLITQAACDVGTFAPYDHCAQPVRRRGGLLLPSNLVAVSMAPGS